MYAELLRRFSRRLFQDFHAVVSIAPAFRLKEHPHDVLPKFMDGPTLKSLRDEFTLPYMAVVVEDLDGCILIAEPKPQIGLGNKRMFIECRPFQPQADIVPFEDDKDDRAFIEVLLAEGSYSLFTVVIGGFEIVPKSHEHFDLGGFVDRFLVLDAGGDWAVSRSNCTFPDAIVRQALQNAATGIEEVMFIGQLPAFGGWPVKEGGRRVPVYQVDLDGTVKKLRA